MGLPENKVPPNSLVHRHFPDILMAVWAIFRCTTSKFSGLILALRYLELFPDQHWSMSSYDPKERRKLATHAEGVPWCTQGWSMRSWVWVNSQETPQHWLSVYIPTSTEQFILGMRQEDRGYKGFDPFSCIGPIIGAALGTVAELCTEMQVEIGSLSSQLLFCFSDPKKACWHCSHEPPPSTVLSKFHFFRHLVEVMRSPRSVVKGLHPALQPLAWNCRVRKAGPSWAPRIWIWTSRSCNIHPWILLRCEKLWDVVTHGAGREKPSSSFPVCEILTMTSKHS